MQIFRVESRFNFITNKGKKYKTTFGPYFTPCTEIDEPTADDVKNTAFYKELFTPFDHEDSRNYSHRRCTSPYEDLKLARNPVNPRPIGRGYKGQAAIAAYFI